jgi:hypothetical protein
MCSIGLLEEVMMCTGSGAVASNDVYWFLGSGEVAF